MLRLFRLLLFPLALASAAAAPSAQEILATARMLHAQQNLEVEGQLREGQMAIPFRLTQTGPVIRYTFFDPQESLQLRLGEKDSRLEAITTDGVDRIAGPEFDQKVRGTAITYADLALRFLYWPTARVLGEDTLRTRRCWKLQAAAPNRRSQYSNVLLWIDQEGGALMKMEGYDWDLKLAKRFEVISAQKIEGRWFLKQMRIEEIAPGTGKVQTRTYLEIKK